MTKIALWMTFMGENKGPFYSNLVDKRIKKKKKKNTSRKLKNNFISLREKQQPRQARDLGNCQVER